ncbi:hypothetical protein GIB67_003099 [Kingdonia uniflora]|uniref:Uncharacterized protein n=1 Tax=Kingdonia uniflora TaxID=39325 RepID=A0A7J7N624_9MAGN|nr:hypothetical protein GIB67_003099 [Kingdonia uniflora]
MVVVCHNLAMERNVPDEDVGRADVFIKTHTKVDKTYQCPEIIEKLQENMNLYPDSNKIGHNDVLAKGVPQIQPSSSYNAPSNSSQATQQKQSDLNRECKLNGCPKGIVAYGIVVDVSPDAYCHNKQLRDGIGIDEWMRVPFVEDVFALRGLCRFSREGREISTSCSSSGKNFSSLVIKLSMQESRNPGLKHYTMYAEKDAERRVPRKRKAKRGTGQDIMDYEQMIIPGPTYQSWNQGASDLVSRRGRKKKFLDKFLQFDQMHVSEWLDAAVLDLVADDGAGMQKQKFAYHWDKLAVLLNLTLFSFSNGSETPILDLLDIH